MICGPAERITVPFLLRAAHRAAVLPGQDSSCQAARTGRPILHSRVFGLRSFSVRPGSSEPGPACPSPALSADSLLVAPVFFADPLSSADPFDRAFACP